MFSEKQQYTLTTADSKEYPLGVLGGSVGWAVNS